MALPTLLNQPQSLDDLSVFSFENNNSHVKIADGIRALAQVTLPFYVLDPIPEKEIGTWLYNHQAAHNAQNAILGITGNDLTDVDFNKPDQLAAWIANHFDEHYQAHQILGLA